MLRRFRFTRKQRKSFLSGASSNVRVHMHDPFPILFEEGEGSKVWDVDGNEYVDYLMAYGTLILGHCHYRIVDAIKKQLGKGTMFGTTTQLEIEAARKVQRRWFQRGDGEFLQHWERRLRWKRSGSLGRDRKRQDCEV